MKREHGFSLVELLIATSIVGLILAATLGTLTSAINATQAITLMADTQENLRAGMNYMVRDLLQAGEGVPQGGITLPNTAGVSAVNRPGPGTPPGGNFGTFTATWTALPAIVSGYQLGATTTTSGVATDMVTVMYADTTLQDVNGHWLNEFPIYLKPGGAGVTGCAAANPNPAPQGSIATAGTTTTVTFDKSCIVINNGNTGINAGDLIMFQNNNTLGDGSITGTDEDISDTAGSMALMTVSNVDPVGNSITLSASDPFNLNSSAATSGTLDKIKIQSGPLAGTYPTTTATRFWLITYFLDNTNPQRPQLMREVNMNPPQAVGEVIENLHIFYDVLNVGSSPVTVSAAVEAPTDAQLPDIRDAYIMLFARSEDQFSHTNTYFRNNLETVVSIRGLDFYNKFQ
ncbi:MAG TPA: prepilin-type N-terminal cleavage/methylation domain-containing protein [Candidatus Acidoferrales bacterium]|nr:prepilin-type N-terminal cleavage/methylation domain-containing protein [Candidatus Acidoferrales bacterium]